MYSDGDAPQFRKMITDLSASIDGLKDLAVAGKKAGQKILVDGTTRVIGLCSLEQ